MISWLVGLAIAAWSLLVLVLPAQAVVMTGPTSPAPWVVSASGQYGDTYAAWKAFDGLVTDNGSAWVSAEWGPPQGWIQLDAGAGNVIRMGSYAITSSYGAAGVPDAAPKDWVVYGISASGGMLSIDSRLGQTVWANGERRVFNLAEAGEWRAIRLEVSANNGYAYYTRIGELEFIDSGPAPTPTPGPTATPTVAPSGDPQATPSASPGSFGSSGSVELVIPVIQGAEWKPVWDLAGAVLFKGIALVVLLVFFRGLA